MNLKKKIIITGVALVIGMNVIPYKVLANDKVSELNEKQSKIQQEQKTVNQEITKKQEKVTDIKTEEEKLKKDIKELDESVKGLNKKIRDKENEISGFNKQIEELMKEKEQILDRMDNRYELMGNRLRVLQEKGGNGSYLEVLLGSRSFGEFISRVSAVSTIIDADQEIFNSHKEDKDEVEKTEKKIIDKKEKLEIAKKELEDLKKELKRQIEEKQKLMEGLAEKKHLIESDIYQLEEEKELLLAQEVAIKKELRRYENYKTLNLPTITDGDFMRPADGRVTSEFGMRVHPIFGEKKGHSGIDIAKAGSSVPVVVAADGTVIRSYYSSSYGNAVFVSHNINGEVFTTVYAHMQNRAVKQGDTIKKGTFLGYMGNTGNSTGQHLHFEIHIGPWESGQPNAVNPRDHVNF
ncbi:murein hydrolase activator EnvC family protein [Virgibacillus halodenitrificans]|uniref:murein hydrolase activator EnvC family protein n=1 Tax=Virgibacillus halodenitrificans TaxID=1482 RepID=UPI000EF52C83|nr:M23 family metallopeptidase [Virgibacillus halodenitrificans]